jgi:hypothetical protein
MAVRLRSARARALTALLLLLLVAAVGSYAGGHLGARRLPVPAVERLSEWDAEESSILWVLRSKDLLSCHTAGSVLRRIQYTAEPAPSLTLVAVATDSAWAASLLRSERLHGRVKVLSEREYRRGFGGTLTPMLYVLHNGRVHVALHVRRDAVEDSVRVSIEQAIGTLRRTSTDGREPSATPGPRSPHPLYQETYHGTDG